MPQVTTGNSEEQVLRLKLSEIVTQIVIFPKA